jgi:hypothetical protein
MTTPPKKRYVIQRPYSMFYRRYFYKVYDMSTYTPTAVYQCKTFRDANAWCKKLNGGSTEVPVYQTEHELMRSA